MVRDLGTASLTTASEAGIDLIGGVDTALLQFPAFTSDEALRLVPQTRSDAPITTYALGVDIFMPQPTEPFVSLLQAGDGDGDVFLRDNGDGTAGIGINGVYEGAVPLDAWTRVVLTVTQESGETVLRKYVDGALVGTQTFAAETRFDIDPATGFKLFNDNDGETAAGFVSSVFFTTDVPTPPEVAGLLATIPAPDPAGFFAVQPTGGAVELDFENEDVTPRYGAADVFLDGFGFRSVNVIDDSAVGFATQLGVEGPDGDDIPVLDYAAYGPDEGLLLGLPAVTGDLSSYTAVWDINLDALTGFQSLLQTDVSQQSDGELFIRSDGGIGINGDYDGTVAAETWHRIAITVEDQGDGTSTLTKYLDGALLDSQTVDAERFTLDATTGFLLLSDNDGETGTGFLGHFGLSEEVLDAAAIATLGGADGTGPFEAGAGMGTMPLPPVAGDTRTLTLSFDSSFRPYDNMTGEVLVSVDGGDFTSLLTLDTATVPGGASSLARSNETVMLPFEVAADASDVAFAFNLRDGGNDWWWAIDNIALTDESGATIFAESFNGLTDDLQPAVDENIGILGWTDGPPEGWSRENAPTMPQGTTEWQGWSFATPEFWTSADGQNRTDFTLGTGVIAIADPDEWDDFNDGSATGDDFDSTLTTPTIALEIPATEGTYQVGFDDYDATIETGFEVAEVIDAVEELSRQDNIKDLLLQDDGTAVEIDLIAAFGEGATDFMVTTADGTVVDAAIDGSTLSLSGLALGHSDITVTALSATGEALTENFRAIVAGENAYVSAIIPDTQDYTSNPSIAATFGNMTDWLLDQQDSLAIQHAIHVGDIVQFGAVDQWLIAEDAMERLDGQLSYTLAIGNHDQQRPGFASSFSFESDVDAYFTPEQVGATEAQGGGTYDGFDVGEDTFANGDTYADSIRNHYTTLETPDGTKWLIFSLEMGMPDDVLRWAGEVIEDHLDHRVIIDTHAWNGGDGRVGPTTEPLTTDNDGWGYAIRENPRGINGGEDAWREFASKYPNITFTFNGHNFMGGAETVVSYGAGGNPTFQTFVNYQNGAWFGPEGVGTNGGNGALRLMVIDPDNDRITTHTKLTELDTFYNDFPDHEEVFEGVDLGAPEQIAIAKAGETMIVEGDGIAATVMLDPAETIGDTTGATFEWFAADGEKLGETDGAPLEVSLKTGTNRVTLVVTDQNGNVSTDDKTVIVEATPELPLVIAHRGFSADRPEHTLEAYQLAMEAGADFIEPDLVSTSDGVLIARHEPWLATVETDEDGEVVLDENGDPVITFASTDIAEVAKTNPDFMARLATKEIGFNSDALGFGSVTGWFAEDFTLAEIKTLRAVEDQPELRPQSAAFDGQFEIPTLEEIIQLVKDFETDTGRQVGIYPETKEPSYFDAIGLSLEETLIQTLIDNAFTDPERIFIQSFEVANLLDLQENVMPAAGVDLPLVQLLFNAPTFPTFDLLEEGLTGGDFSEYASLGFDETTVSGDLFSPEGLALLADVYAEGIGPTFSLIDNGDGTFSDLVDNAQDAGLLVHAYTHRDESGPSYETFLASGVDGVFTDNPDTGRAATDAFTPRLTETFDDGDLVGWGSPGSDPADLVAFGTDLGFSLPSIDGVAQIPITLSFDSSFRPYDNQTGEVLVSFDDGATFSTLLTLDTSTVPGGSSSLDRANEAVTLEILAPNSADNVQIAWRMSQADNDWWWAIDNIAVSSAEVTRSTIFAEDFEGLALDPFFSPSESGGDGTDFTTTPPAGWTRDLGTTPAGVPEFEPWAFLDKNSWIATAGNQSRDTFTLGTGTIAVADGDEYTDAGDFDANEVSVFLETPEIDITGFDPASLELNFNSSFRPYADQTGTVEVSFDGGTTFSTLLTLDTSTVPGGASALTRANEAVSLAMDAGAEDSVIVRFSYADADNDWWWAIDDIEITGETSTGTILLEEDFDDLPLQGVVDEPAPDPDVPVWTPTPPADWQVTIAETTAQGSTEFQGWTFMDQDFWIDTAGDQSRSTFTLASGNVAVADPDEWDDFNDGASGPDEFDSTISTPLIDITGVGGGQAAGTAAGVVNVPALSGDEGILVTPTGTSGTIDSYTIIFDVLVPETTQSFIALFQTDPANADDADIYLRNDGETASIGISGDYDGALNFGEWSRIALVFETDGDGVQTLTKYLGGVLLDTQQVDADVSDGSRWSIDADAGFLLFSEPNGFTAELFANAFAFTPEVLDESAIAALGGVDVDGPLDGSTDAGAFQLDFDGALDGLDFGTATVEPISLAGPDDTSYLVKGSIFGNPDGEGEAALYQQSNGADERLIWLDESAATWRDYTFDLVVEPADNDTVGAIFYYQDDQTFYQLTLNQQDDTRTLSRFVDGEETVLATETASYRHYAPQDLRIAVLDGEITITLDDELMFDGPVTDAEPLSGGSVGILSQGMDRVMFDNISVNPITLAARALTPEPEDRWAVDLDGNGTETVEVTAAASLSAAGIETFEWLIDGAVVATGETASLELPPGETVVTLRVTDVDGAVSEDQITLKVAANASILAADDFEDGAFDGWTIVDEGTENGPSDWQVVGGALVQASDIASPQQGTGSTAFSVEGDGPFILRDGTYALWDDPEAASWTDYVLEAMITPNDDDGIGLLFRYVDADNYYKLEGDAETGLIMLTRHLEGRETILARGYYEYTPGEAQHWRIEAEDGVLTPYIDGKAVFGTVIEDRTLESGTVGLYGWGSEDLTFDDVAVTSIEEALASLPEVTDDSYDTTEDVTLTVGAEAGVLANDSDPEGDALTVSLTTDVTDGTLALNADGSFEYTPDAGFFGTDSFEYEVTDGIGMVTGTATITVAEFQDQPSAGRDRFEGREGIDDTFVFEEGETDLFARDRIAGFEAGDTIDLSDLGFTSVVEGRNFPLVEGALNVIDYPGNNAHLIGRTATADVSILVEGTVADILAGVLI